jgi:predicted DNA-binding WGR domain protein
MKVHLEYINESSDKFWEIETQGSTFTVNYGRNGTAGQSQTKSFEDEARCLKEAEKLVAEKIRKGYSENGEVITKESKPKTAKVSDLQAVLDEYSELVNTSNVAGLLPFLQNRSKGHTEGLKKHIRKAKTYWLTYVELSEDRKAMTSRWGTRGTEEQKEIIVLSAIALFNGKEITPWDEVTGYLSQLENQNVFDVIAWAKPSWINAFLLDRINKNEWISVPYENLRLLEQHGIIAYEPELFVKLLARFQGWNRAVNPKGGDYVAYLVSDETAIKRDIPELFNYETVLHNQTYENPETKEYNGMVLWELVFNRLLNEHKLNRQWFIENCILVQTKEWNIGLRSFFRKRLGDIKPLPGELVHFQSSIFSCLHSPLNAVVNFGIDLIKNIQLEKDFDYTDFFEWVEPVMMRIDCKGGIKTLLGMFDKTIKINPQYSQKISYLTADVFVIPDLTLQERAFKTLEKVFDLQDSDLTDKLAAYLPQMQGNVLVSVSELLQAEHEIDHTEPIEHYEHVLTKRRLLFEENRVQPFKDWNEILFQFGKFISSFDVLEGEKLLNAFITQRDLFPVDAAEQLQPYSKQLQNSYYSANDKNVIAGTLVLIIENQGGLYKQTGWMVPESRVMRVINEILAEVQKKIRVGSAMSLLSYPSHAPHWVAPLVLVERLLEYETAGWSVDTLDLTIAISRMPRENTELALKLCDKLDDQTAKLMRYALGGSDKIDLKQDTFLKKIFSGSKPDNTSNHALWAVAARTFNTSGDFPEFSGTTLEGIPNVASEFVPKASVETRKNEYKNYQTEQTEHYVYRELMVDLPQSSWTVPRNLLYSLDVFERKSDQYIYNFLTYGDVIYWHSIMPQNDQALATMLLRFSCKNPDGGSDELNAFLYVCSQREFTFTETSLLVFACSMFNKNLKTRSYATEILIYLIENRRMNVKALGETSGYLISESYGPLQRYVDSLTGARDVSPRHNSAILILLDALLLNFEGKEKLPVGFKKLLEFYLDVLMKTKTKPSESLLAKMVQWNDYPAIKSVLKQIKST